MGRMSRLNSILRGSSAARTDGSRKQQTLTIHRTTRRNMAGSLGRPSMRKEVRQEIRSDKGNVPEKIAILKRVRTKEPLWTAAARHRLLSFSFRRERFTLGNEYRKEKKRWQATAVQSENP